MGKANRSKRRTTYTPSAVFTGSLGPDEMKKGFEAAQSVFGTPDMGTSTDGVVEVEPVEWETNTSDDLNWSEQESRVRKGMVFWYNIDSSVDKMDNHTKMSHGHAYVDRRPFGHRPWLVLTDMDEQYHTVICAPFTRGGFGERSSSAIKCVVGGKETSLVLSQCIAVNVGELWEYMTWLTPVAMERVTRAWMSLLGIQREQIQTYATKSDAMQRIEQILEQTIFAKMEDVKVGQFTDADIDGVLVKAMSTLQARCVEALNKASREAAAVSPAVSVPGKKKSPRTQTSGERAVEGVDTADAGLPAVAESIQKFYAKFPGMNPDREKVPESPSVLEEIGVIRGSFVKDDDKRSKYMSKATPCQFVDGKLDLGLNSKGVPCTTIRWNVDLASRFLNDLAARTEKEIKEIWGIEGRSIASARHHIKRQFGM